jgi:DUF4097 and DUF4098 domain-containing protein YvlB
MILRPTYSRQAIAIIAFTILTLSCSTVFGQTKADNKNKNREFCSSDNYSSDGRVSFREVREMTIPATSLVSVNGDRNGGIRVIGSERADVLVRACVQAWGTSDEAAKASASAIKIATSPVVKAENASDDNWSVSYEVLVPRNTNLKLNAHNGGISIAGVEGTMEFETTNGGVNLSEVAGDVKGRTTNGGVNVVLSGNSWRGSGLDVTTSNGGVHLTIPETFAAHVETGTVNGGFKSDIAALNVERSERSRSMRISTDLNGGGAPVRVITTNGGIKISTAEQTVKY